MKYYTALWHDDYRGLTDIGEHTSMKNALASLRRKFVGSTAEAGIVLNARPTRDSDEEWLKAHEIGVVNVRAGGVSKKNKILPNIYIYYPKQKYGRHNVKKLVMSDGTLKEYVR